MLQVMGMGVSDPADGAVATGGVLFAFSSAQSDEHEMAITTDRALSEVRIVFSPMKVNCY
jgi:hypothetical protein